MVKCLQVGDCPVLFLLQGKGDWTWVTKKIWEMKSFIKWTKQINEFFLLLECCLDDLLLKSTMATEQFLPKNFFFRTLVL